MRRESQRFIGASVTVLSQAWNCDRPCEIKLASSFIFTIKQILHLAVRKFIQVKKSQSAALRLRRGRNPRRELIRVELRDAGRGIGRDRFLRHHRCSGCTSSFDELEALMPRFVKGPEPIGRQLPARREQRRFAHRILERLQRLGRVAGHEKTEPVKLRQTP